MSPEQDTKRSRETRRAIWETQMSYDAVVILTDGKTRQLKGASREISPMQRVDTDENATSARR